jgi:hypothetical protein
MTEPFLTTDQLAARWGLKPAAIKNQRARGIGPAYVTASRIGTPAGTPRVRYPLHKSWLLRKPMALHH